MDINMFDQSDEMDVDNTEKVVNANKKRLPFPSPASDGKSTTRYLEIDGLKKAALTDLCRRFQLPHSGNMAALRGRLEAFSSNPDKWDWPKGQARRAHLGPRSGKVVKSSAQKKSTQRRELMFENPNSATTLSFPSILSTAVPEQRWNEARHVADLNWAIHIMNLYPYHKEETRMELAGRDAARSSRGSSIEHDDTLKQGIKTANIHLSKILDCVSATSPTALTSFGVTSSASAPSSTVDFPLPLPAPSVPSSFHLPPDSSVSTSVPMSIPHLAPATTEVTRSIVLANDRKLTFTMVDVPPPPVVSFARDIPGLNRMWDDTSLYWDRESVLTIKGVPIPIIYWKEVYTSKTGASWKPRQWESTKGKWFGWKILVKRYCEGTPEQFWAEFTQDGKRLGYRAILDHLAECRTAENSCLVEQIKVEYGDKFSSVFSYIKNGERHVKVKPCDIMKQYRKLKGILDDDGSTE